MCSKEEVQAIINTLERRLECNFDVKLEELNTLREKRLQESHMAVSKSVSQFGSELKELATSVSELNNKFEHVEPDDLKIMIRYFNGVTTAKSLIVGVATIMGAIGAIGAGFIWMVKASLK